MLVRILAWKRWMAALAAFGALGAFGSLGAFGAKGAFAATPVRYSDMPYRQLLWLMTERLERKGRGREDGYGPPEEFRAKFDALVQGAALASKELWG